MHLDTSISRRHINTYVRHFCALTVSRMHSGAFLMLIVQKTGLKDSLDDI